MAILEVGEDMVKNKKHSIRTFDKEGYKRRAGCLCFKDENEDEILLVSSSASTDKWVVPAGGIDPGEDSITAAKREVMEEASVKGKIGRFLGTFQNDKAQSRTDVYVMFVTEVLTHVNLERKHQRWFKINEAIIALKHKPVQQSYIEKALQSKGTVLFEEPSNFENTREIPQNSNNHSVT